MNLAYVHLLLNHVPVLGTVFGICLLSYATVRRHETLFRTSLWTFVVAGLATIPVYFTGEPAEHIVERVAPSAISKPAIESHEDAALWAILALGALAVLALVLLLRYRRADVTPRGAVIATLLLAVLAFAIVARTAQLGGEIHHPEVRSGATAGLPADAGGESDDD